MAADAVVARLVPICVAQFNQDQEKDKKLKELKEESTWERSKYVEEQGWATMPYEKEPNKTIAEKCSEQIMEIGQ
jgi:hypothetical protein